MIEEFLKLTSLIFVGLALYLLIGAIYTRREVKKNIAAERKKTVAPIGGDAHTQEQTKAVWIQTQLERALALIESSDENEILAGLQILSVMNEPTIHVQAFHRLFELTTHDDPRVAKQAEVTIERISQLAIG